MEPRNLEFYALAMWAEGFAAASIGHHLAERDVAWPWAYLIGGAGGIFLSATVATALELSRHFARTVTRDW